MELDGRQARRIALRAQRLGRRPTRTPALHDVRDTVSALGAVQIDAVNTVIRTQYLVLFSRLGLYRPQLLDELVYRRREAFEYWGHALSYLPIELQPALRWRMAEYAENARWRALLARVEAERPGYVAAVAREVAESGPLAFGDLTDPARRQRPDTKHANWFRSADGKHVLDAMFNAGTLAAADRRNFERCYDLAEKVIPPDVRAQPTPEPADAQRTLVRRAMDALGVASVRDAADYFRLPITTTRARLRELADAGEVTPVRVAGWDQPAFLRTGAEDGPVTGHALLSPFDSLIWERDRTRRIFGFDHVFELYVKPAQRRYGYYVLPFLLGEDLVARVDLRADRPHRTVQVLSAHPEPHAAADHVADTLAGELRLLAGWLELDAVDVAGEGALAAGLAKRVS